MMALLDLQEDPPMTPRDIPLDPRTGGPLHAEDILEFIDNTYDEVDEIGESLETPEIGQGNADVGGGLEACRPGRFLAI